MKITSAKDFFQRDKSLALLIYQLKKMVIMNKKILALITPNLQNDCHIVTPTDNKAIIFVTNSAIATRIQFCLPHLLEQCALDPHLKKIKHILCKVRPIEISEKNTASDLKMAKLSLSAAKIVYQNALTLKDEDLKNIMKKIAKRTKKNE